MKITVDDHAPGASAGREAYLTDRVHRVLGRTIDRVACLNLELRPDDQHEDHCRVTMSVRLARGGRLEVSVQRRLLPDALADAFDALVTQIALSGLRLPKREDELTLVRQPSANSDGRVRGRARPTA